MMKILLVASNPIATTRLMLDDEIRRIKLAIKQSRYRDDLVFQAALAATPIDLIRELNESEPDIIHFSGHGSPDGSIVLADEAGTARPVAAELISELLGALPKIPRLAILNACYSFNQAESFSRYIDIVVGMPDIVDDQDAITFSTLFYGCLGTGLNFLDSFRQSVIGVKLNNNSYWQNGEPIFLSKEGVSPEGIYFSGPTREIARPSSPPRPDRKIFRDRDMGRGFIKREFVSFTNNLRKVSILFFDIDGMNSINTNFGRSIGDQAISETFLLIEENSTDALVVGLCGDDTFFVILERTPRADVVDYARSMMLLIDDHKWSGLAAGLYVRVSAGYAVQNEGETPSDVLARAGQGLRNAQHKNIGSAEAADHGRLRGQPFERKGRISEKEILEWFS